MLVGAAVHLWPNLQGSIPKFTIKNLNCHFYWNTDSHMVLWMWHDVTLHPLWKIQATPLMLKLPYTVRVILLVLSPILCNSEQASFWGSTYSHRITILLHFPVLLPLHRYPRLHLRVESLRLLDPLPKKEKRKDEKKKAAETSDQRARFQSLGN